MKLRFFSKAIALLLICTMTFQSNGISKSVSDFSDYDTMPNVPFMLDDDDYESTELPEGEADPEEDDTDYVEMYLSDVSLSYIDPSDEDEEGTSIVVTITAYTNSSYYDGVALSCTFNEATMTFTLSVTTNGDQTETTVTDATVDEDGGLTTEIDDDGVVYDLSDYDEPFAIADLADSLSNRRGFFGFILAIITIYVAVAQTAEQIKAKCNYQDNTNKEINNSRYSGTSYIFSQTEQFISTYKFGFSTFDARGCEVAAVYNLLVYRNQGRALSQVIYDFERWGIEYAIGWGFLGSNPKEIYRILNKYGISYKRYTSNSKFHEASTKAEAGTGFIIANWNESLTAGLHTYFVRKQSSSSAFGYNYSSNSSTAPTNKTTVYDFSSSYSGPFIVGYAIV